MACFPPSLCHCRLESKSILVELQVDSRGSTLAFSLLLSLGSLATSLFFLGE